MRACLGQVFGRVQVAKHIARFARHHIKADVIEHDAFSCRLNLFNLIRFGQRPDAAN